MASSEQKQQKRREILRLEKVGGSTTFLWRGGIMSLSQILQFLTALRSRKDLKVLWYVVPFAPTIQNLTLVQAGGRAHPLGVCAGLS